MTNEEHQKDVIAFLESSATHGGTRVERITTHGAHIFLAGDWVYKLKRAVKLPFLDYSTPERRHAMTEAEFNLNRSLAPDLYRAVIPITRTSTGTLALDGKGEVVDWVLKMHRFSQTALLDDQAVRGALSLELMDALGDQIAAMHQSAPIVDRPEAEIFARSARDNMDVLRKTPHLDQSLVERVEQVIAHSSEALAEHLGLRTGQGFVRRCHGDLHLRNIVCLASGPCPFDALEFDPALATGDVYYDLAFLLMDLDHRGLRAHANRLLNRYVMATDDLEGLAGLPLFLAVRATVRAKVEVLTATTVEASAASDHFAAAGEYLQLAARYLPAPAPRLIAIGGLSGTGKTRAAVALAPFLLPAPGALVVRSDTMRKRLHGVSETTRLSEAAYSVAATERVYEQIAGYARRCVKSGYSCILDAVFARHAERLKAEAVAAGTELRFTGCWLEAPLDVRMKRVTTRTNDASDADATIAENQETYILGDMDWHKIDAGRDLEHSVDQIRRLLEE